MPVRPSIDADDAIVTDLLEGTIDLILEAGGWVDPRAMIRARDGQLSLHLETPEDVPLVVIPRHVMLRVDAIIWAHDDERLAIEEVPDDAGDLEREMLYLQVALHNQCGKLPWLRATHPVLADDVTADLVEAVRRIVPSFRGAPMTARDVLWADRCFRLPLDPTPSRVLVPVVDLLNHHRSGASGSWDGSTFAVTARRPFGTTECALDYGMDRDAMELAVVYGFADTSAVVAHSAPVRPDGAADLDLPRVTFTMLDPQSVLADLSSRTGWDRERAHSTAVAVIDANLALLDPIAGTSPTGPASRTLAAAAAHQRAVLSAVREDICR